jgi:hypothetical protein
MTPHSPQLMMGILVYQACIELSIHAAVIDSDLFGIEVQKRVDTILEICDEAMSRGQYGGWV